MNDKIVFGQYIHRNSPIHKLDPRVKLMVLMVLMVSVFLIPQDNFILLGICLFIPIIAVFFSKISIFKYLKSLKQIAFLMVFSFAFQLFGANNTKVLVTLPINLTILNFTERLITFFPKYSTFH